MYNLAIGLSNIAKCEILEVTTLNDILEDLTIVILTRGRERILAKTLDFWNSNGIKTVVVHNSFNPIDVKSKIQGSIYEVSNLSYAQRAGMAAAFIVTEFAIICNDDEVYIPSALRNMIKILKNDNDLVSVGAQCLAVSKYGKLISGLLIYQDMANYENLHNNARERLELHLDIDVNHIGAMFRVMRSIHMKILLISFKMCDGISTPYIHEVTTEILLNIYGKSLYISEIYWIRNWIEPPIMHENWDRKLYFHIWWEEEKYFGQRDKWIKMIEALSKESLSSQDLRFVLQKNYKIRKFKELNEKNKPKPRFHFLSPDLKYAIKKFIHYGSLPESVEASLLNAKSSGLKVDVIAIKNAIKTLL